jgi:hypothetical protein
MRKCLLRRVVLGNQLAGAASPHAVARRLKGYTSIISILAERLSNWCLNVRVLLPKISLLKRSERDAEPVGRMMKGKLCPLGAAGFKTQD